MTTIERAQAVSDVMRRIRETRRAARNDLSLASALPARLRMLEAELSELLDGVDPSGETAAPTHPEPPQREPEATPAGYWR